MRACVRACVLTCVCACLLLLETFEILDHSTHPLLVKLERSSDLLVDGLEGGDVLGREGHYIRNHWTWFILPLELIFQRLHEELPVMVEVIQLACQLLVQLRDLVLDELRVEASPRR